MSQSETDTDALLARTAAPDGHAVERLDVRDLPPPEPLTETLKCATDLGEETVLLQFTDRVPQHLYPRLDERDLAYETVETETFVATAIWQSDGE